MLQPGDPAPGFRVPNQRGETVDLADLRGKTVVLWFYPKADTPGWTKEGTGFRDELQGFEQRGAVVYGVSFDDQDANRRFAEKYHFNFDLLCDTSRQLGLAYGACADPAAETATRISYVIGPDGIIKKSYPKVVPADHPRQVLDDLDQL